MASLNEIEADLDALPSRLAGVAARIVEISTPKEKVQRVRIAGFFDGALDSEEAIRQAVEELREHLMKLHAEGFKIVVE
jgi:ferritin